jgi:hypothetical protein
MSAALRIAVIFALGAQFLLAGSALSKSIYVTGNCACKKGSSTVATYGATICSGANFHEACTDAKNQCSANNQAACALLGGKMFHSGTCKAGDKC